jgi:hypothetical protein
MRTYITQKCIGVSTGWETLSSIRLSVRMKQSKNAGDRHGIIYLRILWKNTEPLQLSFRCDDFLCVFSRISLASVKPLEQESSGKN